MIILFSGIIGSNNRYLSDYSNDYTTGWYNRFK